MRDRQKHDENPLKTTEKFAASLIKTDKAQNDPSFMQALSHLRVGKLR